MKQVKEESSMEEKRPYWWWFDSHNRPRHSHWLHSTLAELDDMTKAMLRLIEEDADSFAERAEMYYKKRPELISMVEDFYRSYRSLAERYDQLKNDSNPRVTFPKATSLVKSYDDCYIDEAYDSESEVDDPEGEECFHANGYVEEKARFGKVSYDEVMKLREEVDQLRVEKMALEEEGGRTNEEKEKVARQLNEAIDELVKLKEETGTLRAETMALREQLERKDEVNKDIARQIDEMSSEMTKLREESHRENQSYKEELLQKNKEQSKITSQLHEAKTKLAKLREETDALRLNAVALGEELKRKDLEKIKIAKQIDEVFEKKDEEKREVIRQLTVAIQMMKDENLQLKRSFMKETSKNGGPFEFKMFKKPVSLGKLFNFSSNSSIVPL